MFACSATISLRRDDHLVLAGRDDQIGGKSIENAIHPLRHVSMEHVAVGLSAECQS